MQPSTVISLNECPTASPRAPCSSPGDTAASVVSTASIVAMFGASMAAPFAMPPTTKPSASMTTCLVLVSVVKMALAATAAQAGDDPRPAKRIGKAAAIFSTSRRVPIVPVEQTRTFSGATASARAASSHVSSAASRPGAPVAAFAYPLLRTTAAVIAPLSAGWARETCTGAAAARLDVKTAAEATGPESAVATSARSRAVLLDPRRHPRGDKAAGASTLTVRVRDRQSRCLFQAEGYVRGLDGLARSALYEVVQRCEGDDVAGAGVVAGGDGTVFDP